MSTPQKFRKKPVEIEAIQWVEDEPMRTLIDFTNGLIQLNDVDREFAVYDRLHDTWVKFGYGDWIIKGVQGEFYPCREDIFQATYEPAESRAVLLCTNSELDPQVIGRTVAQSLRRTRRNGGAA